MMMTSHQGTSRQGIVDFDEVTDSSFYEVGRSVNRISLGVGDGGQRGRDTCVIIPVCPARDKKTARPGCGLAVGVLVYWSIGVLVILTGLLEMVSLRLRSVQALTVLGVARWGHRSQRVSPILIHQYTNNFFY